jgi:hypothetical protein
MAQSGRTRGLALMALGTLVFMGTNKHLLPAIAFWPALAACVLGMISFVRANRVATDVANERVQRALDPTLRNQAGDRFADRQAQSSGLALQDVGERHFGTAPAEAPLSQQIGENALKRDAITDSDAESDEHDPMISTDVSFPVELQEQGALGGQLAKLERLRDQGIINSDEFAVAKAKLLR